MDSDSRLSDYGRLLESWPGLIGRGESAALLVADSLAVLPFLGGSATVVDVGSGGGMPGIPVAIALPAVRVTLLESDRGKAAFLVSAVARLGLANVEVVAERAEAAGQDPRYREAFDAATCRALASLPVAAELCLPLVRVGGRLVAMRTSVEEAREAVQRLGGGEPEVNPAPTELRHDGKVVVVEKVAPTPAAYPRRAGVPARRPLGT